MTDKTKLYEALGDFIDAVALEDDDAERSSYKSSYIGEKAKTILEFNKNSKIQLDGNDVMVGGKKVGTIKSDVKDMESGINFVSDDGKFSKEFDDVESLYGFISDRFNVKEGVLDLSEGRVEDAVFKQDAKKSERAKRWAAVRNKVNKDGTPGDYESGTTDKYKDPIKGGDDAAFDGHGKDKRHLKGYYDSHDPRKDHKDRIKGGSEAAHPGAASDLDTDGGYDSHDVRKNHNS